MNRHNRAILAINAARQKLDTRDDGTMYDFLDGMIDAIRDHRDKKARIVIPPGEPVAMGYEAGQQLCERWFTYDALIDELKKG